MLQIGNYVGVVEYGITVMIFVFNIVRLVKNKENKYYKERRSISNYGNGDLHK